MYLVGFDMGQPSLERQIGTQIPLPPPPPTSTFVYSPPPLVSQDACLG